MIRAIFKNIQKAWSKRQAFFFLCLFITGCASVEGRIKKAQQILATHHFISRTIQTPTFKLFSAARLSPAPKTIHVVIEGDGYAWVDRYTPSNNPTPRTPSGMKIASALRGDVLYLARPCQYVTDSACGPKNWTSHRFSQDILMAFNNALDQIKSNYGNQKFILNGFSGGAYIAMQLAQSRNDIPQVYTISGLIDPDAWTTYHNISPLHFDRRTYSEKPDVFYHHICGADDDITPCTLTNNFIAQNNLKNHSLHIIPGANHQSVLYKNIPALLSMSQ